MFIAWNFLNTLNTPAFISPISKWRPIVFPCHLVTLFVPELLLSASLPRDYWVVTADYLSISAITVSNPFRDVKTEMVLQLQSKVWPRRNNRVRVTRQTSPDRHLRIEYSVPLEILPQGNFIVPRLTFRLLLFFGLFFSKLSFSRRDTSIELIIKVSDRWPSCGRHFLDGRIQNVDQIS